MVPFWPDIAKSPTDQPKAMKEFAEAFASVPQIVVFSKTLSSSEEKNTTIFRADLRDEVIKLKQAPGDNILTGGVDIPSQLLAYGLVDAIRLVVHPVIAGQESTLERVLAWPDRIRAIDPAKRVVLSQVWLSKANSKEPQDGRTNANVLAREAFSFWAALDATYYTGGRTSVKALAASFRPITATSRVQASSSLLSRTPASMHTARARRATTGSRLDA